MAGITIGMNEEEHRIIKERAKKNRQSLSQYMLFCALEGIDFLSLAKGNVEKHGYDAPAGIRTPLDSPLFKISSEIFNSVLS